ncbi:hypothetical protein DPSP01_011379 [Paraphaeosphaeria sporulosa]
MSSNKPQGHSRGKLLDKNGKRMFPADANKDTQTEIFPARFKAAKLSTSFIEDDFFDPATATNEDFELKLPKKATSTNANNKTKDEKGERLYLVSTLKWLPFPQALQAMPNPRVALLHPRPLLEYHLTSLAGCYGCRHC